ncbi:hypothetical protein [Desulfoscipio sp. XC116]
MTLDKVRRGDLIKIISIGRSLARNINVELLARTGETRTVTPEL